MQNVRTNIACVNLLLLFVIVVAAKISTTGNYFPCCYETFIVYDITNILTKNRKPPTVIVKYDILLHLLKYIDGSFGELNHV